MRGPFQAQTRGPFCRAARLSIRRRRARYARHVTLAQVAGEARALDRSQGWGCAREHDPEAGYRRAYARRRFSTVVEESARHRAHAPVCPPGPPCDTVRSTDWIRDRPCKHRDPDRDSQGERSPCHAPGLQPGSAVDAIALRLRDYGRQRRDGCRSNYCLRSVRCATLPPVQGSISRRAESRSSEASKASTTSSRWRTDKANRVGLNRALTVTSLTVI
jgi:hypothetical protein